MLYFYIALLAKCMYVFYKLSWTQVPNLLFSVMGQKFLCVNIDSISLCICLSFTADVKRANVIQYKHRQGLSWYSMRDVSLLDWRLALHHIMVRGVFFSASVSRCGNANQYIIKVIGQFFQRKKYPDMERYT